MSSFGCLNILTKNTYILETYNGNVIFHNDDYRFFIAKDHLNSRNSMKINLDFFKIEGLSNFKKFKFKESDVQYVYSVNGFDEMSIPNKFLFDLYYLSGYKGLFEKYVSDIDIILFNMYTTCNFSDTLKNKYIFIWNDNMFKSIRYVSLSHIIDWYNTIHPSLVFIKEKDDAFKDNIDILTRCVGNTSYIKSTYYKGCKDSYFLTENYLYFIKIINILKDFLLSFWQKDSIIELKNVSTFVKNNYYVQDKFIYKLKSIFNYNDNCTQYILDHFVDFNLLLDLAFRGDLVLKE